MHINGQRIVVAATSILILFIGIAFLPVSSGLAQDAPAATSTVELVENASKPAGSYARQNPGIAVAVFLGTESVVTPEQIRTTLTKEFVQAGVDDPVTFFFDQNDVPGTAVAYYFSDYVDGPFNLADARPKAVETAEDYNFRKSEGLLTYSTSAQ